MIYTLRTEGGSRGQEAWAIGLGLAVGFSPFVGLHLGMCIALGWLFGLNRLKLYLAANLVNPLIMPGVLFVEVQLGSWLRRGETYALSMDAFSSMDPWHFGLDLLVGGMVLSIVGGLVAGLLTYAALGRRYRDPGFTRLSSAAADRYLGTSLTAWEFARAKLRGDPVYRAVLASGWLPRPASWSMSGAGRDCSSRSSRRRAKTPTTGAGRRRVAGPANGLRLVGIELRPRAADRPAMRSATKPRSRPRTRPRRGCPRRSIGGDLRRPAPGRSPVARPAGGAARGGDAARGASSSCARPTPPPAGASGWCGPATA